MSFSTLLSMQLLESQNRYPDCLTIIPDLLPANTNQWDLSVTLQFNQHAKSLLNGSVRFGLKGGKLSLKIDQGAIAPCKLDLRPAFTVHSQSTPTEVTWNLALCTSQFVYRDTLEKLKLATLTSANLATLTFTVEVSDVSLTDAEGLWRHDISPNKHGILERYLARFLWERRFTPYLSCLVLGEDIQNTPIGNPQREIPPASLGQLQTVITKVYEAKTDDLLSLSVIAELNPLEELAGGNLLAAELSNISLSGANLYHTNLRGANLTDADLSEANLSHAKLSGADLSGAYLGNTNLSYSDLHKSSLALANLIGADLRGANLQEVNLSNTNLSGALLEGCQLGNNIGLSAETKQHLQERGALIV